MKYLIVAHYDSLWIAVGPWLFPYSVMSPLAQRGPEKQGEESRTLVVL